MDSRKLKALLRVLNDARVTSFRDGDLSIQFGDPPLPEPTKVELAAGDDVPSDERGFDPRDMIAKINRKHAAQ